MDISCLRFYLVIFPPFFLLLKCYSRGTSVNDRLYLLIQRSQSRTTDGPQKREPIVFLNADMKRNPTKILPLTASLSTIRYPLRAEDI